MGGRWSVVGGRWNWRLRVTAHCPLPTDHRVPRRSAFCVLRSAFAPRSRLLAWLVLCATCLALCGCGDEYLDKEYGRRRGPGAATSVNGTAVLAEMFEEAGHRVTTERSISSRLDKAEMIVWFPDDNMVLDDRNRQRLERWLFDKPGRTLVYVGRDWDAEPAYWKAVEPSAPAEQAAEINRLRGDAEKEFQRYHDALPDNYRSDWYSVRGKTPHRDVRTLDGPWSDGIDPAKIEIELHSRVDPPQWAIDAQRQRETLAGHTPVMPIEAGHETLLGSAGDSIVFRLTNPRWRDSQIVVVANGSFLLNLPLVNHEHRKLAGKLIALAPADAPVVFLEMNNIASAGDDSEGEPVPPTDLLAQWPLSFVLLHLAVLGILFCFARLPVFGRPRSERRDVLSDFGHHLKALGKLLALTRDRQYAQQRLNDYQRQVRPEAGGSGQGHDDVPQATLAHQGRQEPAP